MERLLAAHSGDAAGVILRLAWREGLRRAEIAALRWEQVDFSAMLLRLTERAVPLSEDTAECLRRERFAAPSRAPRVLSLAPQAVSRLARGALNEAGMADVRLIDLRLDCARRLLRTHDWPYVLRVTGFSLTTYRQTLTQLSPESGAALSPTHAAVPEEKMEEVIAAGGVSAASVALRLTYDLGMRVGELAALTWDTVDLRAGTLALPRGTLALTPASHNLLARAFAARAEGEDPHVLLTPRSRCGMDAARLSALVREALLRGGVENVSLAALRSGADRAAEERILLAYARQNGSIGRADAARLLGISPEAAYTRLRKLVAGGVLVRVNTRCYLADGVVPPERHSEVVRGYLEQYGSAYRQDVADLLHVPPRTAARLLARMVEHGELVCDSRTRRYALAQRERV